MKHRRDQNSWQRQTCLIHALHTSASLFVPRGLIKVLFYSWCRFVVLPPFHKWASTVLLAKNHSCPHTLSAHRLGPQCALFNFFTSIFFFKYHPPSPCSSEVWESDLTSGPCPLPPNTGDGGPRTCPRILHFYHSALCLFPLRGTVSP